MEWVIPERDVWVNKTENSKLVNFQKVNSNFKGGVHIQFLAGRRRIMKANLNIFTIYVRLPRREGNILTTRFKYDKNDDTSVGS